MRPLLLLTALLPLAGACQHTRPAAALNAPTTTAPATRTSAAPPPAVIRFERTPCMGFCPTFVAELTADGTLRYHGGPNAPYPRDTTARVAPEVIHNIQAQAVAIQFARMPPDEYGHGMMDAPSAILTIGGHTVNCVGGQCPPELKDLHRYLDRELKAALGM